MRCTRTLIPIALKRGAMNRTPVLMARLCFRNSVKLGCIARCAVHGAAKVVDQFVDMVCHRSSDKLCIDLVLDCDMFFYCIRYRGHQT